MARHGARSINGELLIGDERSALRDSKPLDQGTEVAVEGTLEEPRYLYLVELDSNQLLDTLFASGEPLPQGAFRVPDDTVATQQGGRVRLIGSLEQIPEEELADICVALFTTRDSPPAQSSDKSM